MAARGRGGGLTPHRVVKLLTDKVSQYGQSAVARETGLTRQTVQRYLQGIGEPSQETLEKLSAYFQLSIAELRGEHLYNSSKFFDYLEEIQDSIVKLQATYKIDTLDHNIIIINRSIMGIYLIMKQTSEIDGMKNQELKDAIVNAVDGILDIVIETVDKLSKDSENSNEH